MYCDRVGCGSEATTMVRSKETDIRFPACESCAEEATSNHEELVRDETPKRY